MSEKSTSFSGIKNFTEFLEVNLNRIVLDYELKPLTKPGDNYGAILWSVDVKVAENKDVNVYLQYQF